MDDGTKLSPKQLFSLLSLFKGGKADAAADPAAFLKAHLTEEQTAAAQQLLQDPQKLQALLNRPQVHALLQRLQQQADEHGRDTV